MNMVIGIVCLVSCTLVLFLGLARMIRSYGYDAGKKDGYLAGRKDADNWWIGIEAEADQALVKIWREEMRRGSDAA